MLNINKFTLVVLPFFIILIVLGYLIPLSVLSVAGKTLVLYPYEIIIILLVFIFVVRKKIQISILDSSLLIWLWLVLISIMMVGLFDKTPLDIWMRSTLYTAQWIISLSAFFIGRNVKITDREAIFLKRLLIFTIISFGIIVGIIQVITYKIPSFIELTRYRLGYFEGLPGRISMINPNQLGQLVALALAALVSERSHWCGKSALGIIGMLLLILTFSREAVTAILK